MTTVYGKIISAELEDVTLWIGYGTSPPGARKLLKICVQIGAFDIEFFASESIFAVVGIQGPSESNRSLRKLRRAIGRLIGYPVRVEGRPVGPYALKGCIGDAVARVCTAGGMSQRRLSVVLGESSCPQGYWGVVGS